MPSATTPRGGLALVPAEPVGAQLMMDARAASARRRRSWVRRDSCARCRNTRISHGSALPTASRRSRYGRDRSCRRGSSPRWTSRRGTCELRTCRYVRTPRPLGYHAAVDRRTFLQTVTAAATAAAAHPLIALQQKPVWKVGGFTKPVQDLSFEQTATLCT